ncbi:MAG: transglycosylase domain-containing protein, partial [Anaerolineales bacterium]|nr:transglycosylase domain-containing protein [Anaerolineales bacterium]
MTETEQPKKPNHRFKDLIDGSEELENDQELIKSQLDSLGISPEGKLKPESEDQTSEILPSHRKDSAEDISPNQSRRRVLDIGENSGFDETEVLGESSQQSRSPLDDTPPPSLGSMPFTPPPALDARGMPLPRRMDEAVVRGNTSPTSGRRTKVSAKIPKDTSKLMIWWKKNGPGGWNRGQGWGCIFKMLVIGLFIGIMMALIAGSFAIYHYNRIAATLPDVEDLKEQASKFETTRILDREGNVLYELLDPNEGRRTYVPLEEISPFLVAATIATEDSNFYSHPGYDVMAIARSF